MKNYTKKQMRENERNDKLQQVLRFVEKMG